MQDFTFQARSRVVFAAGGVRRLPELLAPLGAGPVLVVTDRGVRGAGLLEPATTALEAAGRRCTVFDEVEPDPLDTTVERGAAVRAAAGAGVVVAIGGGSSIDTAKGIAVLGTNPGRIRDYDGRDTLKSRPLPLLAVPTTAGTGSEVSSNAAITDAERHYKMSIRSVLLQPEVALLDPELLRSLPRGVAAQTGVDALSHAMEGYLSRSASPMTDRLALEAMEIGFADLSAFVADRTDTRRGGRLLYASMLGGMILSNAPTGIDHALARAVGGAYGLPHGQAVALFLAATVRFNAPALPEKLARLRAALDGEGSPRPRPDDGAVVAARVEALVGALGLPTRLSQVGVDRSTFGALAATAVKNTSFNIRPATERDLVGLLEEVA